MSGIVLAYEQHIFICFPGKKAAFASKRGKNPILECGCRKSEKFSAGFSSFTVNNVTSVGRLRLDRIVSGKVNALAKEGSGDGGSVSVIEKDSRSRSSFFDEYVKAMEYVKSNRDKKPADDADRNSSKRVLPEEVGQDDGSLSRDDARSTNRGDEFPRNSAIRNGKFEGRETRAYEKVKVASKSGTGRKEKQNFRRYLDGPTVDKNASNKVSVHEAGKDNRKVGRDIASKGLGDKSVQNSVWKRKDEPESKENRVDREAKRVSKDELFRKERQVLAKDFKGHDSVVGHQRTSAAKDESVRKERQVLVKDFGRNAVGDRQQTYAANDQGSEDRYAGEEKPYAGKRSYGQDRRIDSQWVDTARYGNKKNNVKFLGNGIREGKVIVNGYASERGFRNKKKVWQSEYDDAGFEIDRAAFRTSEVPGEIVDRPRLSHMEMEERIQKLAMGLNGADIEIPEWMFSQMMRSAKIKFSDHTIMRVIQILGKLGNWRRVLQVIEWLQVRERYKSHKLRYIYTAALDAMGKARRPVEAFNLFQTMQNQMSSYPDLVAYHSIAVTLGQAGHMRELFDVIDVMRSPPKKTNTSKLLKWDPRLEPDLVVYNAVLNACVKRKQWEGAFWVLQQLKENTQQPSSTTYGLVMEVMLVCEKYNLVHELFRKVQKSGIPSALIYKVLVNTLWREGKTDEAVSTVQEMEQQGIVGSAALYYDLARCLCSAGRCQEALMLMEKICKVASKPLVVTYTGLIQTCLDCGEIQNAAFIFNEMEKFCSPNLVTCNIMLNAYIKHGMFEETKELFNKILRERDYISCKADYKTRVLPDTYTFNTMLDACFEGKMWDDLEFVFQKMLDHGYHFNVDRHLRIVLESSRAGKTGPLEATWNYFARSDRTLPPALMKEHFCTKLEKRNYAAALSSFFSGPGSNGPGFSKHAWSKLLKENIRRFRRDGIEGLVNEVEFRVLPSSSVPNPELETLLISCKEVLGIKS